MDERGGGSGRHSIREKGRPGDPMAAGLSHLARRARTIAEMRSFLKAKGHPEPEINRVVSRLMEMGYLNDRDYAERFVASCRSRPRGRVRLTSELLSKGVPREIIDSTLASSFTAGEESEALNRALAKAVSQTGGGLDAAGRRRVASRLLRRGFASAQVCQAIAAMGRGMPGEGDDDPSGVEKDEE